MPETDGQQRQANERGLWLFLRNNKKWWIVPIVLLILLLALLVILSGSGSLPAVYTLF